jgi:hypothetical protein
MEIINQSKIPTIRGIDFLEVSQQIKKDERCQWPFSSILQSWQELGPFEWVYVARLRRLGGQFRWVFAVERKVERRLCFVMGSHVLLQLLLSFFRDVCLRLFLRDVVSFLPSHR